MGYVSVNGCKCERCGHIWYSRKAAPIACAKCKSAYWNIPIPSNIENKDKNTISIDLEKHFVQTHTKDIKEEQRRIHQIGEFVSK